MDAPPASSPRRLTLRSVRLHVTCAANFRSRIGVLPFRSTPAEDELTTAEILGLWPQVVALSPQRIVCAGGDPLRRTDLLELLDGLRGADPEHRIDRCLQTDGARMTPELAEELVGLVDHILIPLTGLQAAHDDLCGPGSFSAAARALELLHAIGFEPTVLMTLTAAALPGVEDLLRLLLGKGVARVLVQASGCANYGLRTDLRASPDAALEHLRRVTAKLRPPVRLEGTDFGDQDHCGIGEHLSITPNGDVYPCGEITPHAFRCGNVRRQPLAELVAPGALLERMANLSFARLARLDARLIPLRAPGACLAQVYAQTASSPAWRTEVLEPETPPPSA